jgi:hypothetical protein
MKVAAKPISAIDKARPKTSTLMRGAGDGEHVVERHRHVGDDDLHDRLPEGFWFRLAAGGRLAFEHVGAAIGVGGALELAPHLPRHPEQKNAPGEQQADDLQQRRRHQGEDDPQRRRGQNAEKDRAPALSLRQSRGGKADDDGVIAGERDVDPDDLKERRPELGRKVDERPIHVEAPAARLADERLAKPRLMP